MVSRASSAILQTHWTVDGLVTMRRAARRGGPCSCVRSISGLGQGDPTLDPLNESADGTRIRGVVGGLAYDQRTSAAREGLVRQHPALQAPVMVGVEA